MNHGVRTVLRWSRRLARTALGREVIYKTQAKCLKEAHGSKRDPWVICPTSINRDSVIYSFGIGKNISFDLSLINRYGVYVHAFDPTPDSIQWLKSQSLPQQFLPYEYGVADYDGVARFFPPENTKQVSHSIFERPEAAHHAVEVQVYRLPTILEMLGHTAVDILKLDIEGAEYTVIADLIKSKIKVQQLLVEFHHRFPKVGIERTKTTVKMLNNNGFRIFSVSPNGYEYSFIRA